MEITRKNYEAFFIDYLEGNLDETLVDSFIEFLQQNPDLKEELDLFKTLEAVPDSLTFENKSKLYHEKYDLQSEFDNAAVASLEGDITDKEKAVFEAYLSNHPEKQKDAELFIHTILKADENIQFGKKQKLYRKTGRRIVLMWMGRAAAVLILALAIFSLTENRKRTVMPVGQVAEVNKETPKNEVTPKKNNLEKDVIPLLEPLENNRTEIPPAPKNTKGYIEKGNSLPIETGLKENEFVAEREPLKIPDRMSSLYASIETGSESPLLAAMILATPEEKIAYEDEGLISDSIREKFSLKNIIRAGLNLVASISNDRFRYKTDRDGRITGLSYDSQLVAFYIPTAANPK